MHHIFHKNIKQHIDNNNNNNKCDFNVKHIRMISEGSCDTDDWINDIWLDYNEYSALHHRDILAYMSIF